MNITKNNVTSSFSFHFCFFSFLNYALKKRISYHKLTKQQQRGRAFHSTPRTNAEELR